MRKARAFVLMLHPRKELNHFFLTNEKRFMCNLKSFYGNKYSNVK